MPACVTRPTVGHTCAARLCARGVGHCLLLSACPASDGGCWLQGFARSHCAAPRVTRHSRGGGGGKKMCCRWAMIDQFHALVREDAGARPGAREECGWCRWAGQGRASCITEVCLYPSTLSHRARWAVSAIHSIMIMRWRQFRFDLAVATILRQRAPTAEAGGQWLSQLVAVGRRRHAPLIGAPRRGQLTVGHRPALATWPIHL